MTEPKLPTVEQALSAFLDDLRNEHNQWLWEIVWGLNTRAPDVSISTKVALAREVVARLDGLAELSGVPFGRVDRLSG